MTGTATSIAEVIAGGLCIGCGLCEAVSDGRVRMEMTAGGSLRPTPVDGLRPTEEQLLLTACPGVIAEARPQPGLPVDPVWGSFSTMRYAWARDPDIRFGAATGGVLTALAVHLVRTGGVAFVLHLGADPARPLRSRWVMSDTAAEVVANTGSRYGPTAPLAGLHAALAREEPFAIVGKPCDLGAVHRLAGHDDRIDAFCVARLALVCGGQSRLSKTRVLLDRFGVDEDDVALLRYRGHGNPGPARVETHDGRAFEATYLEMWADESGWDLETRCKFCPDALGEAADVAAADVWPGGAPIGDDDGFNGIIVRSQVGEALVTAAAAAGDLVLGANITPREFDDFQPHQVRRKRAVAARLAGRVDAGLPVIATRGLRIAELGAGLDDAGWEAERTGTVRRDREGRIREDVP